MVVARTVEEAYQAVDDMLVRKVFGGAGETGGGKGGDGRGGGRGGVGWYLTSPPIGMPPNGTLCVC